MSIQQGVKSACVVCAIGHFSTSSKFLNEAVRFKKDGLASPQILDDIAEAIGEQNALERIDLTPAKIESLPDWEKEMAENALEKSRELRHRLETVQSVDELQSIAVDTEEFFRYLNREWASKRIENCPTCQIKASENMEETEPKPEKIIEAPKSKLSEYGSRVSMARRKFLEEIQAEREE